jgi:photosystem II stability/assembly factor-like uncharacterized protein
VQVTTDSPPSEFDHPSPVTTRDDAEALFREARRRRRIRRAWMTGGLALALVALGVTIAFTSDGPTVPPAGKSQQVGAPKTALPPNSGTRSVSPTGSYSLVQTVGLADAEVAWAASSTGIYVSTDRGSDWRTVTPPNLADQDVVERIGALSAVGADDLWLVLVDVPGLVPYEASVDGSDRGAGIDRSTDGGRTWTFASLPGCLQSCGANLSVSFTDAQHGFATIGPGESGPTLLFSTVDGGATWVRAGDLPDLGSILVDAPGSSPQMEFVTAEDGWVVTRTTDAGSSWSHATGLPTQNHYLLPTFFGRQDGVVLATSQTSTHQSSSVYITVDGGATWAARRLPHIPGLAGYKPGGLQFRFAAIDRSSWKIDVGSTIYSTRDAGRRWLREIPRPKARPGMVTSAVFSSPQDGLAITEPPACSDTAHTSALTQCFPTLTGTTDGGKRWSPVTP